MQYISDLIAVSTTLNDDIVIIKVDCIFHSECPLMLLQYQTYGSQRERYSFCITSVTLHTDEYKWLLKYFRKNWMVTSSLYTQHHFVPGMNQNGTRDRQPSVVTRLMATPVYQTRTSRNCWNSVTPNLGYWLKRV